MRQIHLWCQSFEANPGGIQMFTQFVVKALRELYPGTPITIFAKNDLASRSRPEIGNRKSEIGPDKKDDNKDVGGVVASDGTSAHGTDSSSGEQVACAPRIVGFGRWPRKLRAFAFAFSALCRAWSQRDLLIFSTHANFGALASLAKKLAGARVVVVGHGIEVWNIAPRRKKALRSIDQLLAVSDFTRKRLAEQLDISTESIELLPNTFDEQRFKPAEKSTELLRRYGLTDDMPVILTVARLEATEQYKGYDKVTLSLPEVLQRFPSARYLIVGDGPDRRRVEELSRELRVEGNVIFAGYVPNEELPDHYNLCDVFAMPSKHEGFGIVFLEALGCGKPVIAGNKDGSVEPLLNGKLGTLVDPESVDAIGQAICETLAAVRHSESVLRRIGGQKFAAADKEPITDNKEPQLDPERLRREVVAAFGYERFKERIFEILKS